MSPVGPGGTDTLTALLDEPVPYLDAGQWRLSRCPAPAASNTEPVSVETSEPVAAP